MSVIALITDFGLVDPYVGIMKGVIYSIYPEAQIVDLSHRTDFFDVCQASFYLEISHKFFPHNTVFVNVVDPGVGGTRMAIALRSPHGIFVAPDNGCLSRIFALYPEAELRAVLNPKYMLLPVSNTFHGRDIFAPIAAHLAKGLDFSQIGPIITDPVAHPVPKFELKGNKILAQLIHIDNFGNLITNIPCEFHDERMQKSLKISLAVENPVLTGITYETLPRNCLGMIPGSSGYYEIVINQGSAASRTGASVGDTFTIELSGEVK